MFIIINKDYYSITVNRYFTYNQYYACFETEISKVILMNTILIIMKIN